MAKIDLSYLESIAVGDKDFIKEMLELFLNVTFPEIETIENLSSKKDWDMIGLVAHRIKAPVQILGQTETYDLILILENNVRNKINLEHVCELISKIKSNMLDIKTEVKKLLETF